MAFQPSETGCIEVVFRFTLFSIPLVVVITVCLDSGLAPSNTQIDNIAGACANWVLFHMMPVLSKDLHFVQVQATDIHVETGYQRTINYDVIGGIDSQSLPSQIAVCATLYTGLRGRSYRGRSFFGGIPVNYQVADGDTLTVDGAGAIATAYGTLAGLLSPYAAHQAVLSRYHDKVKRDVAVSQPVTSINVNDTFDTLRRRGLNAHRS